MRRMLFLLCLMLMIAPLSWIKAQDTDETATAADRVPQYREIARIQRGPIWSDPREHFAFNPDGTQIAAAATDTTVNVWNIETGEILHVLEHESTSVSWSPDGTMIATGIYQGTFRVWNAADGTLLYELESRNGRHSSWSPDSSQFVTDEMKIFDAQTGKISVYLGDNWSLTAEALWSPDGTMIATPGFWTDDYLNIWSAEGERLDTYWGGETASWSPDSTRLVTYGQVREIATGLPVAIIPEIGYFAAIAWHPTEEWIASTGENGQIFLWDATTGELLTTWQAEDCLVDGFVWSADGERFAHSCFESDSKRATGLVIWERVR